MNTNSSLPPVLPSTPPSPPTAEPERSESFFHLGPVAWVCLLGYALSRSAPAILAAVNGGSSYVAGFAAGQLIASIGLPWLLAWIVGLIAGRSGKAFRITLWIVVALMAVAWIGELLHSPGTA